jgi:hypothetical protein
VCFKQTFAIKYCNNFIGRLWELLKIIGKIPLTPSSWKNQYIGKLMIKWSGDIENYCNILSILPWYGLKYSLDKRVFLI